jgi:hypothetical protein
VGQLVEVRVLSTAPAHRTSVVLATTCCICETFGPLPYARGRYRWREAAARQVNGPLFDSNGIPKDMSSDCQALYDWAGKNISTGPQRVASSTRGWSSKRVP